MKRGKYNLKRRAERQEETRLRIARATVELHEILGPSKTTISAIAERAVEGGPAHLLQPLPRRALLGKGLLDARLGRESPSRARALGGDLRPRAAVEGGFGRALYAYFRRRERMLANVLRDAEGEWEAKPHVREIMEPMVEHWERMEEILAAGWKVGKDHPQPLPGAIGLALDFQTWHTMVRKQGLSDEQA